MKGETREEGCGEGEEERGMETRGREEEACGEREEERGQPAR